MIKLTTGYCDTGIVLDVVADELKGLSQTPVF